MSLHTNMLRKSLRVYEWLDQKRLGIHFLFLSKNDINSVLKIPVANMCQLLLHKFILDMAGVWPPKISVVYHRHNHGGSEGAMPPKFLAYLVLSCGDPNQILLLT